MIGRPESFEELKKIIYLWIVPVILASLIIYNLAHLQETNSFDLVLTRVLIAWYLICWYLLYKNIFFRFVELFNLAIISLFHVIKVYDLIFNYMAQGKPDALDISSIWVPAIIIIFFFTLKGKLGLYYSLSILGILLFFGISNIQNISSDYLLSLSQFYFAYGVYILIFYFAQFLFKVFTELEIAKISATTDSLTGIANRHQLDRWLENTLNESLGLNSPVSILFFDIDHFKKVNDTFGHNIGDSVLIELTNMVKDHISKDDLFGRWGGEEFIIITKRSKESAVRLAEQLNQTIQKHKFKVAGRQTASFGVTVYRHPETVDSLIYRVDKGLYESKQNGRNLVTLV